MNNKISVFFIFLSMAALTASCGTKSGEEEPMPSSRLSSVELKAKFPYDLGEGNVDVSMYPDKIQEDYKVFLAVCSSCHTTARPLNSPFVSPTDWKRYVERMHLKMADRRMTVDPKLKKQILDFLVFDSKIRKIDGKQKFQSEQDKLNKLFDEVSNLRMKLIREDTLRLPTKEYQYTGIK